ncbi:hypothetical protein [Agrobacterium pusense]|uniref:hypothetical protein n=1 Tax=Agrobacterium pusense TaxID=648995 RepID=UPI000884CAEE|nr:hypothetical protein [Agrobacterium pusense]MBW9058311.1 hypothetical protein [Agrobacterium pusense]OOO17191.1 hypothetical protein BTE56_18275 [Agrobacterium pusense]WKD45590.1 hypothetical protein M8C82_19610 [Agrobacterium pusense]SDF27757.1 hypothetical protein SAMN05421750_109200 [Agrobacterium pusense]
MAISPEGKRFSHVYLQYPELLQDSVRMRRRLGILISGLGSGDFLQRLGRDIEREHGIQIVNASLKESWPGIITKFELRDVLDVVTTAHKNIVELDRHRMEQRRSTFISGCRRIFEEEQVRYKIDDKGGVHFAVDIAFEANRVSTIQAVASDRYQSVRGLYEEAFAFLDRTPPDGKAALRSAFFATEGLFRLMFANSHQLSSAEVLKHLDPLVDRLYAGQKPAISLAKKLVASLRDWIDGAHFYRHEPGSEEPAQPPLELAIYMLSEAGGHIRWLAKLDEMSRQQQN